MKLNNCTTLFCSLILKFVKLLISNNIDYFEIRVDHKLLLNNLDTQITYKFFCSLKE